MLSLENQLSTLRNLASICGLQQGQDVDRWLIILLIYDSVSKTIYNNYATDLTLGFRLPAVQDFSLHHHAHNSSGAHPASYPMGTVVLSLGVKRQGREAQFSSEVKNVWSYTSTPPYAWIAWCLVKYKEQLYLNQVGIQTFSNFIQAYRYRCSSLNEEKSLIKNSY
jgi:hypothetical protein